MSRLKVLIACEFSGVVREAFRAHGHEAWSCDLEPSEQPGSHIQGDVLDVLADGWDLMIAFPPCTYLCSSGARWWKQRQQEQRHALAFVQLLLDAPIPRIALENPEGCISTRIRRPSQIIHPWEYGEPYEKKTHLWLRDLPLLQPTQLMAERQQACWRMGESRQRQRERSRTYPGVGAAMAAQWGETLSPTHPLEETNPMTPDDLIAWRTTRHLSQHQVAALLGVHPVTVARWECGMRALTPQTVAQLQALMAATPIEEAS